MNDKTAWERQCLIREKNRPTVNDYIPLIFEEFYELHGDRHYGDDAALMGGIARIDGMPVTVLAEVKGRDLNENKKTNFAMPHPEGYRKALRLAKQAELDQTGADREIQARDDQKQRHDVRLVQKAADRIDHTVNFVNHDLSPLQFFIFPAAKQPRDR